MGSTNMFPHCLSSAAAATSKPTSSDAVSLTFFTLVVPAQWHCHFGHFDRFYWFDWCPNQSSHLSVGLARQNRTAIRYAPCSNELSDLFTKILPFFLSSTCLNNGIYYKSGSYPQIRFDCRRQQIYSDTDSVFVQFTYCKIIPSKQLNFSIYCEQLWWTALITISKWTSFTVQRSGTWRNVDHCEQDGACLRGCNNRCLSDGNRRQRHNKPGWDIRTARPNERKKQ